ncbi:cryptochrome/photolyase family protein [Marichromatium gracile]|uniref:Deoxyribodipyrimidine photo-lyase n=1 Tax=Marichromatium gracile TaxID=1048 RepID=A0A4R4A4Z0_MARGR|nr:deoxyribodipyrimidine photo-lyase [Marichromatium gracile]MBK1710038.1 deoxyribodipyrimidine photolyase [Marichromatium gracile]TCW33269.1 deoxyribodipyrimidine photo-lyase [Marichromatium gracile]
MSDTVIVWFRRDLRLDDNPALEAALRSGARILPVYIHAPDEEAPWAPGAASRWWLHHSLEALDAALRACGARLWIGQGESLALLRRLAETSGARAVHWNRLYDPATRERDTAIKQQLRAAGLDCTSHKGALLFEPWEVASGSGAPYKVFSAFWRHCTPRLAEFPDPIAAPVRIPGVELDGGDTVAELDLLPRIRWDQGLAEAWTPGEHGARTTAERFLAGHLDSYGELRDHPDRPATSRLSPHLHFGEIGPHRLLALTRAALPAALPLGEHAFVRELGWREFAYHLLYHFPQTPEHPLDTRFADYPWREPSDSELLERWQQGRTGIPLVDAGMRELWHTGWMHNRVRMVAASLLTKNLRLPWQLGARWFWDTLVDADLASNTLGWQWTAGCGADAAPYFRVFNPVRQGERFDPNGNYVRRWCPELARLPDKVLQQPWTATSTTLARAGVGLGVNYPTPIVDLAQSRREALAGWEGIKSSP